jgi:hypothetical protein
MCEVMFVGLCFRPKIGEGANSRYRFFEALQMLEVENA